MKRPASILIFLVASSFLVSCQKEIDPSTLSGSGAAAPGNGPGTGGSGTETGSNGAYFPISSGTWWKYKDTASNGLSTETVVNRTKTINNIVYTAMLGENGVQKDTGWAAAPQPNYYLSEKGVSPNTGAAYDLTFHYLNDTASVGYTWRYAAGQGNGFTSYIQTTIIERNITMVVSGKSFSNVIHTRLDLSYNILGSVMDFMTYDYFVAKGVGIIKVRSEGQNLLAGFKACSDLVDYSIK
jgi:hypothetical protein